MDRGTHTAISKSQGLNPQVIHVDDSVDPVRDLETIQEELCKKDLVFLANAVARKKP